MAFRYVGSLVAPTRFPIPPTADPTRGMKAIIVEEHGPPEVMKYLENFPSPQRAKGADHQVVVDIVAAGINPVDFKLRKGPIADFLYPKPKIVGSDMAGIVVDTPVGSKFNVGDRVYAMLPFLSNQYGSYAGRCVVDENILALAASNYSLTDLASIPLVATTVIQAMRPVKSAFKDKLAGKKCFIPAGSGGLGCFAIQYCANALGMVVGTSCSSKNIDFVKSIGAHEVVDYSKDKIADVIRDYDVFLDSMGYQNEQLVLDPNSSILKRGTRTDPSFYIRIASSPYGDKEGSLSGDPLGLAIPEARVDRMISGFSKQILSHIPFVSDWTVGSRGIRYYFILVSSEREALVEATDLIEKGHIRPVIQECIPLSEAVRAHRIIEAGHVRGKLVLLVNSTLEEKPAKPEETENNAKLG